jgi:predicted DNA-binding antitoxin AbrB/MazE fold protein
MTLKVEATYENGMLKLKEPLPMKEHEKVQLTIQPASQVLPSNQERAAGLARLLHFAGAVNIGHPTGADYESIDADLAKEYGGNPAETP